MSFGLKDVQNTCFGAPSLALSFENDDNGHLKLMRIATMTFSLCS
jgi:hypothetical protein